MSSLIPYNTLANFWPKSIGIPFKARPDGSLSILLMFQIIETVIAIAHVAEFPIGKAVTVSGKTRTKMMTIQNNNLLWKSSVTLYHLFYYEKLCILLAESIYVFHIILRINSYSFPKQLLTDFCNEVEVCFL